MPRKQIVQFTAATTITATDRLIMQQGAAPTPFTHGTVAQVMASGAPGTFSHVTLNGATAPTNGAYLPAANTVGIAVNGAGEVQFTSAATSPMASDGNALGTSSLMWSDLFLASGGVINFNNGDVTLTHSAGTLAMSGALAMTGGVIQSRATIAAAGTSQATATTLTAQINIITSGSAGQGVVLSDQDALILNRGTVEFLVYPPSGAQIEAYGTNTAIALPVGGAGNLVRESSLLFRVL